MAETGVGELNKSKAIQIREASDTYKNTTDSDQREEVLNTSLVVVDEMGIADPASFRAVKDIAVEQIGKGGYMPDVINELNGDNLVGVTNAIFQKEGAKAQTLTDIMDRIHEMAAKETSAPAGLGSEVHKEFKGDLFREMAERILDPNNSDGGEIIDALSRNATPELVQEILKHQPELLSALIANSESIQNEVLRDIVRERARQIDPDQEQSAQLENNPKAPHEEEAE